MTGSRSNGPGPSSCASGSGKERAAAKNRGEIETGFFFMLAVLNWKAGRRIVIKYDFVDWISSKGIRDKEDRVSHSYLKKGFILRFQNEISI